MRAAKAGPPGEMVKGNENSSMPVNFAAEQKSGSKICEGAALKRNAKAQGRGQISIAKSAWTRASTRTSLTAAANAVSSSLKHKASKLHRTRNRVPHRHTAGARETHAVQEDSHLLLSNSSSDINVGCSVSPTGIVSTQLLVCKTRDKPTSLWDKIKADAPPMTLIFRAEWAAK